MTKVKCIRGVVRPGCNRSSTLQRPAVGQRLPKRKDPGEGSHRQRVPGSIGWVLTLVTGIGDSERRSIRATGTAAHHRLEKHRYQANRDRSRRILYRHHVCWQPLPHTCAPNSCSGLQTNSPMSALTNCSQPVTVSTVQQRGHSVSPDRTGRDQRDRVEQPLRQETGSP